MNTEYSNHGQVLRPAILLKTLPPRAPAEFLVRRNICLNKFTVANFKTLEISAPHGYGKTSQLAQWYREAILSGMFAMWISAEARDTQNRFIHAITAAAKQANFKNQFADSFVDWIGSDPDPQQALTAWLSEIGQSSGECIIFIDDADILPLDVREASLNYLMANMPSNLTIAMSTRPDSSYKIEPLDLGLSLAKIGTQDLEFKQESTLDLFQQILGPENSIESSIRIQALTAGWPLGVRLAIASQARNTHSQDLSLAVSSDLSDYFYNGFLRHLPDNFFNALVTISHLDPINSDLFYEIVSDGTQFSEVMKLANETPIFSSRVGTDWYRLHPTVKNILHKAHEELPLEQRKSIALKAANWYAENGLFEEGALQADIAGDRNTALKLAELCFKDMLKEGRNTEILEWYGRMTPEEITGLPGVWIPTGWAMLMSNQYAQVEQIIELVHSQSDIPDTLLFESYVLQSSLAAFQDKLSLYEGLVQSWPVTPTSLEDSDLAIIEISKSHYELQHGQTEQVRLRLNQLKSSSEYGSVAAVTQCFVDLLYGMSFVWDGNMRLAYDHLEPALIEAESRLDRRNRTLCMLAATLSRVCMELDKPETAKFHLALRMPIIEKHGLVEAITSGYLTITWLAISEGRQDQALSQLSSLLALGQERGSIRMEATALVEIAILHTFEGRMNLAFQFVKKLENRIASRPHNLHPKTVKWLNLQFNLIKAISLSRDSSMSDMKAAKFAANRAEELASELNCVSEGITSKFILAQIADRNATNSGQAERQEAKSLCQLYGLTRLQNAFENSTSASTVPPGKHADTIAAKPNRVSHNFLTPRESEILDGLVNHLSNKEIARAIGMEESTVKWHLKNLFRKLDTGDRKTAVGRAKSLGII